MTIQKNVVLWDNGRDRLCLLRVPFEQQPHGKLHIHETGLINILTGG